MKLRTHTPEELRELERINAEYKRMQQIQAKLNDRKAQADRQREHFRLTPHDDPQRRLI